MLLSVLMQSRHSFGAALGGGRDRQVGVHLRLEEGAPGDPHVDDGQPSEAARHPLIRAAHRWVLGRHARVEEEEQAEDGRNSDPDDCAKHEILELDTHGLCSFFFAV